MKNWKIKIDSVGCPNKIYPIHTINSEWNEGYCKLFEIDEKDVECKYENCPLKLGCKIGEIYNI